MINVLVVDDYDIVRAGFTHLLSQVNGVNVIGEASCGEDAIIIAKEKNPHVILMDVSMPGIGGLVATKRIAHFNPDIKIIALTAFMEEPFPSEMLQAGADGHLAKGATLEEIVLAIKTVRSGKKYGCFSAVQQLLNNGVDESKGCLLTSLSNRETQVMMMIAAGLKVEQVAAKLSLMPKTIHNVRYEIFKKLEISGDIELIHLALKYDMIYQAK